MRSLALSLLVFVACGDTDIEPFPAPPDAGAISSGADAGPQPPPPCVAPLVCGVTQTTYQGRTCASAGCVCSAFGCCSASTCSNFSAAADQRRCVNEPLSTWVTCLDVGGRVEGGECVGVKKCGEVRGADCSCDAAPRIPCVCR